MDRVLQFQQSFDNTLTAFETKIEDNVNTASESPAQSIEKFAEVESLKKLNSENLKLRYQLKFLQENIDKLSKQVKELGINIDNDSSDDASSMMMESIIKELNHLFKTAILKAFPTLSDAPIVLQRSEFADFQCNSALQLVKMLPVKKSPVEIAKSIIANIDLDKSICESIAVSGPGFMNIVIKQSFVKKQLLNIIINGVNICLANPESNEHILVDYSSPNIAKEMHVGHLRSTIIGDSISRVFEFVGYNVLRINHVGDWGTQFGMLLAHLMDKFPDYKTAPPPIADLQMFYKESKKRFDDDSEFKKRAYDTTVRLQAKEPDMIQAWKLICDISRKEFSEVYKLLGIHEGLTERGESFYHDRMNLVVKDLIERNLAIEEDGRRVFYPKDKSLPPLTIVKSDGGYTYDTSDMAAIKQRVDEDKATRIIYTVDAGQGVHFQTIFDCAKIAGYYNPSQTRVDHCTFGVVLGEDKKKFKTRSGDTVKLKDLINEGLERSLQKLIEKGRDKVLSEAELRQAQEAVAVGCIKYSDLSHDRNHDYIFSFDRMLDDRGNTAVYLLYALTRIRSIIRNAKLDISVSDIGLEMSQNDTLKLDHPREMKLAKFILNFTDVIVQIIDDLFMHSLCKYLYDLSVIFNEFYDQCYVIQKINENEMKVNYSRIILCEATARIMEASFSILGIKTVEKM